jgi:hypothetical protein
VAFSRFGDLHVKMLQQHRLPEEMTVTAVLPGGQRHVEKVKVPYVPEDNPDWALARLESIKQDYDKLAEARALPENNNGRKATITSAYARILEWTTDSKEASKVWQAARDVIRGDKDENRLLEGLQVGQMNGAWLRGDADLYRTLVTERERLGIPVDAHQYLTLIIMLVQYKNDVEAAHAYWPKFKAAVGKMPDYEQKRFHYDEAVKQDLLLPSKRIEPGR